MYQRIVLKLSGEALAGTEGPFDPDIIGDLVRQVKVLLAEGVQLSLVIGGGNFWRGRSANPGMDRCKADQIGMLATVMNAIYFADSLRQAGVEAVVTTPFPVGAMTELFEKDRALAHLKAGRVLIFAGGLGHPYFSTDTICALRGAELEMDGLFFAKFVDGVYDSDPAANPQAKKYDTIACADILRNNLKVIDLSAASLCLEQKLPVVIFGLQEQDSLIRAVHGEPIGTTVLVDGSF